MTFSSSSDLRAEPLFEGRVSAYGLPRSSTSATPLVDVEAAGDALKAASELSRRRAAAREPLTLQQMREDFDRMGRHLALEKDATRRMGARAFVSRLHDERIRLTASTSLDYEAFVAHLAGRAAGASIERERMGEGALQLYRRVHGSAERTLRDDAPALPRLAPRAAARSKTLGALAAALGRLCAKA